MKSSEGKLVPILEKHVISVNEYERSNSHILSYVKVQISCGIVWKSHFINANVIYACNLYSHFASLREALKCSNNLLYKMMSFQRTAKDLKFGFWILEKYKQFYINIRFLHIQDI